ncbi:MAG TPA: sigma-70 family RNA polymerase sigma factor [Steroidobacteraceae bacterium]|nr:sigma-70 family RNA polymerase sigma factor [Steroidobacteraceae bacterium]HQW09668.1 sigma-70 family RNA polymerase sigma factor [Steroidobacteraceae bacterium]HQX47125.1 sigma-70 family RNA polymerase sigma factor [Steroidobacteraceae bacterium]HQX77792.1 sigma-70 family RNA polymerase sigma factor [Steroidobacteraceae bacterium]HQZ79897.1 sigma-70 family RNA polymerase sigma factor [Steroidobacteraceae bacterium]
MSAALDSWFAREILVHEQSLERYLRRCWPHRDDVHDLRQDIYVRVYEAAGKALPTAPKSFLFTTARNLMTDRLRRAKVVPIFTVGDFDGLNVLVEDDSLEHVSGRQALARLAAAFDRLPDRCREAVWLRRVEDLPQKAVAQRMGVSEKTVEKHLAKGVRQMAAWYYGGQPVAPTGIAREISDDDGFTRQQAD